MTLIELITIPSNKTDILRQGKGIMAFKGKDHIGITHSKRRKEDIQDKLKIFPLHPFKVGPPVKVVLDLMDNMEMEVMDKDPVILMVKQSETTIRIMSTESKGTMRQWEEKQGSSKEAIDQCWEIYHGAVSYYLQGYSDAVNNVDGKERN